MTTTEEVIAKAAFDYSEGVDVDFAAIAAEVRGQLAELSALRADTARLDWLADTSQSIGSVVLPTDCVMANLESLRGAIDMAMKLNIEPQGAKP